jgi:hypothetical protein
MVAKDDLTKQTRTRKNWSQAHEFRYPYYFSGRGPLPIVKAADNHFCGADSGATLVLKR